MEALNYPVTVIGQLVRRTGPRVSLVPSEALQIRIRFVRQRSILPLKQTNKEQVRSLLVIGSTKKILLPSVKISPQTSKDLADLSKKHCRIHITIEQGIL